VRILAFLIGLAVVSVTAASVFTTLVVPRATSSRMLRSMARTIARILVPTFARVESYEAKDRALALIGPLAMVALFVVWLAAFVAGFGLMAWWVQGNGIAQAFEISGSSVFTLGIVKGGHGRTDVLEFVAAGTGLLVVALEIAYLPTLYAAFSEREAQVTMLASRAGTPAWGPEILARHHRFSTMDELPELYRVWERWSAGVAESHTSYPTLMWFRSPDASRSWLLALLAMMDSAALYDAVCPGSAPRQTRIFLQMSVDCLRALARALRIPYDPDPLPSDPVRLRRDEFDEGIRRLAAVGFPVEREPDEAWRHFCGWRVGYEPICDVLSRLLMPPQAPWLVHRPHLGPVRRPGVVNRTPDDPEAHRPAAR